MVEGARLVLALDEVDAVGREPRRERALPALARACTAVEIATLPEIARGKSRLIRGPAMRRIQKNVPLKVAALAPIPQP